MSNLFSFYRSNIVKVGGYHYHDPHNSRDIGQMVHNYKRVVKGLGCMTVKVLG